MRTSVTHPLQIAEIPIGSNGGKVGLTLCPGKKQANAITGQWDRDLTLDLDVVRDWNAAAVVTLIECHEFDKLQVSRLGSEIRNRHIAWYHLPIADRGIPSERFEARWAMMGEALRARLRDGFNVLVHCMGGLGRAGTIASRLLIELGVEPEEAVAQVRAVRPGAIETEGQLDYVMQLGSLPEPTPDRSAEAIKDRAIGALVGLAVGDAVGTTLEFRARDTFPLHTDMTGGGPFRLKAGEWTDDTSMALALMDSLNTNDGLDERDLMDRFVSWYRDGKYSCTGHCFDIGNTVRGALLRYQQTGNPIAGSSEPTSAGNGSLMRLAPVAVRYWNDRDRMREIAARQSRTTHGAPEAVDACVAFAEVLADAIEGLPRTEVLRDRDTDYAGAIAPIMAGSWRNKERHEIHSSGYVAHSLEAALWCIARTGSFEEAVLLAANLGDDADTTAAITGQLAGALYGLAEIPLHWTDYLAMRDEIVEMAEGAPLNVG